jgi:hypothetical protein
MNLSRHASVLWRFRRVTAAGVILGIALAVFASYSISSKGLTPRGSETWSAVSQILVTQPGFPEGRVTLPEKQIDDALTAAGAPAVQENADPKDQVEFADPARLGYLGDVYAKFITSDAVLSRVPERDRPLPAQVQASSFASAQGGALLPVVQLTTMGLSADAANQSNHSVYNALREFLEERQKANDIGSDGRIELQMLVSPDVTLMSGRKPTASVLILMLVLLGTVAVTHLLEALRNRREAETLAIVDWDASSVLDDRPSDLHDGFAAPRAEATDAAAGRRLRT